MQLSSLFRLIQHQWRRRFASRSWVFYFDQERNEWMARRWHEDAFEVRMATKEEAEEAEWMWAIR